MHRSGVRQNRFDVSKIDADRHGACSLQRSRFSEFDEALAIEFWKLKMTRSAAISAPTPERAGALAPWAGRVPCPRRLLVRKRAANWPLSTKPSDCPS